MNAAGAAKEWTMLGLLDWTTEHFRNAGIEDARLNAEQLLSEATGLERIMLYARFEEPASPDVRERFRSMVRQRLKRCPLQYVLGYTEFYGRRFDLNRSVMVPRPETELLVEECLGLLRKAPPGAAAADIGTGSGAVAVTLACEEEGLSVYATDISEEALGVAGANAALHGVDGRIVFVRGSLFDALPAEAGPGRRALDLAVSNPPYIPSRDISGLQPEVRLWEPREALDGGPDGLQVVGRLLDDGAGVLKPGCRLVLELGAGQSEKVCKMIENRRGWRAESVKVIKDAAGHERVLSVEASPR